MTDIAPYVFESRFLCHTRFEMELLSTMKIQPGDYENEDLS